MIEDRPDALWTRDVIEAPRVERAPALTRIVVAVDPPVTTSRRRRRLRHRRGGRRRGGRRLRARRRDRAGAGAARLGARAPSRSIGALRPTRSSSRRTRAASSSPRSCARSIPACRSTEVHARRGKYLRAEPVSVLYDKRRVHHVGAFPELEDEMCDFGPGGLSSGRSPDRLDALVWALNAADAAGAGRAEGQGVVRLSLPVVTGLVPVTSILRRRRLAASGWPGQARP